ncbi:MAG: pyruvate dehydrogenase (acetyl-transferring) E1 component subunit alpha [Holosporales bacterium]|jgi:pyruvate dehydrogenase E1 component alpha subunit|nr:pyruvate dehydrogenase (acetyl-transferring) E1 component subunit alpha [Holosporales bacterium]
MRTEEVLDLYRKMVEIRKFEEKSAELYTQGYIRGFCHLYIGQEAVVTGIVPHYTDKDSMITSYRDHGHMLALGVDAKYVMAELCGKISGCAKGKGGSMHLFCRALNFYGGNGIVGAQVSIGTGLAFAHKYNSDGGVAFVFYGDGAANQGQVYESFNMAALWKLPVLFILENNRYALGTSLSRSTAMASLEHRGDPFGIRTVLVDGMNVLEVLQKSKDAINHIRAGGGPIILHVDTYRLRGHSMSDPGTYRARSEVEAVKNKRDPIKALAQVIHTNYGVTKRILETLEEGLQEEINKAAEVAINAPPPPTSQLSMDILV